MKDYDSSKCRSFSYCYKDNYTNFEFVVCRAWCPVGRNGYLQYFHTKARECRDFNFSDNSTCVIFAEQDPLADPVEDDGYDFYSPFFVYEDF
jgi:hypothetical protein